MSEYFYVTQPHISCSWASRSWSALLFLNSFERFKCALVSITLPRDFSSALNLVPEPIGLFICAQSCSSGTVFLLENCFSNSFKALLFICGSQRQERLTVLHTDLQ